jgi:hypothetical protein
MVALLGVEELIMQTYFSEQNFALLPAIPVFFIAFGIIAIKLVYSRKDASVAALMAIKMVKILISLMFILAYVFLVKTNAVSFLVSYLIYFLAFLIFETWMLSIMNKKK